MGELMWLSLQAGCAPFDAGEVPAAADAGCEDSGDHVSCTHVTVPFTAGLTTREVHLALPEGPAPDEGFPVALLFQGSTLSAEGMWEGDEDEAFGGLFEARLVEHLLDAGYAVIAPEARFDGATWWQTNTPPTSWAWTTSEDHRLMLAIFAAIDAGDLGPLDPDRLYAAGISSGGYMTSRMAVSYPGRFRALAIQSASYATCGGVFCVLPALPADHPPTLFLHGARDAIVPIETMRRYADALADQGTLVSTCVDDDAGHEWLDVAPDEIPAWFAAN